MSLHHNNPPAHAAMAVQIEELFETVSGSTASPVKTDEQEAALADLLATVRKTKKRADAQRVEEKRPHDEAAKAVQANWKPLIDRCAAGEGAIKAALTPYREARERAKQEEARKVREQAEAERLAAEKALQKADDLDEKFAAQAKVESAAKLEAVANRVDRSATGLRTYWEAEVTDRKAALLHFIKFQPERFAELVQQMADEQARGSRGKVPGVQFHERKKAA